MSTDEIAQEAWEKAKRAAWEDDAIAIIKAAIEKGYTSGYDDCWAIWHQVESRAAHANECPHPDETTGERYHKYDKDGFCIFCGNRATHANEQSGSFKDVLGSTATESIKAQPHLRLNRAGHWSLTNQIKSNAKVIIPIGSLMVRPPV